jgi:hypothetical protein
MGLRDLARRLKSDPTELDQERLQHRCSELDPTSMHAMPSRSLTRVGGEVVRMRVAPRHGVPALEIVLSDGTGTAVAIFTGRRAIGGLEHGRMVIIEGVPRDESGRRVILNPAYTLLASH